MKNLFTFKRVAMALLLGASCIAVYAADNISITQGSGTTLKTKDVGGGVEESQVLPSDASGNSILGVIGAATAPASMQLGGLVYNSSPLTLTTGQSSALQGDVNGYLNVDVKSATGVPNGNPTSGQTLSPVGCAVTTSAPTYTTANTYFISCNTSGGLRTDGSGVTQPVSGTVTANAGTNLNTSLLALESGGNLATIAGAITSSVLQSNVKQINGIVPLMGNGTTGTGSQRGTIASDNSAIALWGQGATGSAAPANAVYAGANSGGNLTGIIQADSSAAISVSTATTTQIVALSSGKKIYVTSLDVIAGGTGNITFEYGTGSSCGTGTTVLTGAYNLTAQSGLTKGSGLGPVLVVPASNALCVLTSAAVQMSGSVSYTQF